MANPANSKQPLSELLAKDVKMFFGFSESPERFSTTKGGAFLTQKPGYQFFGETRGGLANASTYLRTYGAGKAGRTLASKSVIGAIGGTLGNVWGLYEAAHGYTSGFSKAYNKAGGGLLGIAKGFQGGTLGVAGAAAQWAMGTVLLRGAGALLMNPYTAPVAIAGGMATLAAGGLAYGGYKLGEAALAFHYNQKPLEFAGSTAAFDTVGAATMRQRSMLNIQKSHINARSAFGAEAQYSHIASYRGMNLFR